MYKIVKNKLIGSGVIDWTNTKKKSGKMKPKFLVLHYTANPRSDFDEDMYTLSESTRKVSCHIVVGIHGQIGQIGFLDDVMWHAGVSEWKGYRSLNYHSIGIEVTCPGWGTVIQDFPDKQQSLVKLWNGTTNMYNHNEIITTRHKISGEKHTWIMYTPEQIDAVIEVGSAIMKHYGILEAVGHDMIAPDRKVDPGPCCPDSVFHALNGNRDEVYERRVFVVRGVGSRGLNIRDAPTTKSNVLDILKNDSIVDYIRNEGKWYFVSTKNGLHGWVYSDYLVSQENA